MEKARRCPAPGKKNQLSFRGHKARWPHLEDRIEQWVIEQRTASRSVSTVSIRLKAKALAGELDINDFQGTPSWCFRFMKRRNLSIRTRTTVSQQLPDNYQEKLISFRSCCTNKINDQKILLKHITNMDEVPLTFDIPVNRTVEKTIWPRSHLEVFATRHKTSFCDCRRYFNFFRTCFSDSKTEMVTFSNC